MFTNVKTRRQKKVNFCIMLNWNISASKCIQANICKRLAEISFFKVGNPRILTELFVVRGKGISG